MIAAACVDPPGIHCLLVSSYTDMPRPTHYSPVIKRDLVSLLYHEAKQRKLPMTKLVDKILRQALEANETNRLREEPRQYQPTR